MDMSMDVPTDPLRDARTGRIDRARLMAHLAAMIEGCEQHTRSGATERRKAREYYDGTPSDMPAQDTWSKAVSKDLRAVIKKIMPTVMRVIFGGERVVSFAPVGPEDSEAAAQATDYINMVVLPESRAQEAIYDAVMDAFIIMTGILKWSAFERTEVSLTEYRGQGAEVVADLEADPEAEIVDLREQPETDPIIAIIDPEARRFDFSLRRRVTHTDIRLEAIERDAFLIDPDARSIEESPIIGDKRCVTRSELVARGFDRRLVAGLATATRRQAFDERSDLRSVRSDQLASSGSRGAIDGEDPPAMQYVEIYELYVRLDLDGDGIAERYRIEMARTGRDGTSGAQGGGYEILQLEEVSEAPYAEVVAERTPHRFEGHSLAEDVSELQRIKTMLLRSTLDNLYLQNRPQIFVDTQNIDDRFMDHLKAPRLGQFIGVDNARPSDVVHINQVPFFASNSFAMLNFLDGQIRERTGISDRAGSIDPENFQNMTATSAQLMADSGIAQAEMIVRSLAQGGLKRAFEGLLRLVIAHADKPRTVHLRGKWVEYDPRIWNAGMNATVNIGLGAGSRERDLKMTMLIAQWQEKLLAAFGTAGNPFVSARHIYNTLEKMTEAGGLPNADPFFRAPLHDELGAVSEGEASGDSKAKADAQIEVEQAKAAARASIERAQMEADLKVREAEMEKDATNQLLRAKADIEALDRKLAAQLQMHDDKMALEREKLAIDPLRARP